MANDEGGVLTVARARAVVGAGFRALEGRRQHVNDLNVYPVPDGDTGTNLCLTVRAIVEDLQEADPALSCAETASLIANAALMGARGNSGVILSQMIRGAVEPYAAGQELVDATAASAALAKAAEAAYRAVRKPVEGTMLTVLRDTADAAGKAVEAGQSGEGFVAAILSEGWESVRRTPALLKVLADAGVVDAGGYGLMVLLEGMARPGEEGDVTVPEPARELAARPQIEAVEEAESKYTYCTSFLLRGEGLDAPALESALFDLGDSLLVVGTDSQVKVHVHTDEPGRALALATAQGTIHEVEIDNMRDQTAARTKRLREAEAAEADLGATDVVAVVAGEGVRRLFQSLGTRVLVEGGQSMNPSAEELLRAVESTKAPEVLLLPNNKNIIMVAEQVAAMSSRPLIVLPTRSVQAGLSAMVAFDPQASAETNRERMGQAVSSVMTGEVTRAVRDSRADGVEVKAGEYLGLVEDRAVASGPDMIPVVEGVAALLIADGRELVTVLVGDGADAETARVALDHLRELYPEVEVEVHEGGQPLYPLLLSAE